MFDDISFIPDTISLMSKLKEPDQDGEHSLSRIIREQAINYQEEIPDEDIGYQSSHKFQNGNMEKRSCEGWKKKQQMRTFAEKVNLGEGAAVFQRYHPSPTKESPGKERKEKKGYVSSTEEQIRVTQRKTNFISFEEIENHLSPNTSKKEKRVHKLIFDEQKTKKIEFQDIDRVKQQVVTSKKIEGTRIKKNLQVVESSQGQLQLCSKDSSEMQFEEREINILNHRITSNYNALIGQVREMMTMNRWYYIDLEKVELRKMISRAEGQIRKMKIGCRGLFESCESKSKNISKSKLLQDNHQIKIIKKVSKLQTQRSKGKIQDFENKLSADYGFDPFEPQLSKSCVFESNIRQKMDQLQKQIIRKRTKSNKLAVQFNDIMARYNQLKQKATVPRQNNKMQFNPTSSAINRVKILKEKVSFLKSEIRQTKEYFSSRIKRLKNENSILKNESKYTEKGVEDLMQCIKNIQKNTKKYQKIPSSGKPQLYIFDQNHQRLSKCSEYIINPSKVTTTSRDMGSNLLSLEVKSLKSINSVKSIQSFQSFGSKPSLGSLNSQKSTKTESVDTKQDLKMFSKPKLKITSPHMPVVPAENTKQYSIITKRKKETEARLGLTSNQKKQKKISSLDLAFNQLQQKYLKETGGNSEYYSNRVK